MNTKKLLSAACIAVLATSHFPADRLFAQSAVAEPLQLGVVEPVRLRPNQLLPVALQILSNTAGGASALPEAIRYVGADPPAPSISTQTVDPSGTAISLTEGNLIESQGIGGINCATCRASQAASNSTHGISFAVTYNSRDADASRTRLDTVMGNGWTHSFNIFLFSQLGSIFRFDGDGRVTKFKLNPDNTFTADTGYFETLVRKTRETFVITQKDRTRFTFASVPGTPFGVGGPVFRLTQVRDRNDDTLTLTYNGGNLVSVTDTYGRALTFTYNAQQNIAAVTDPLGRSTAFTYDSTGTKLTTITDPLGKTTQYTYNTLFQLTTKIDKDGRLFSYSYTNNKPTGSTDSLGASNFSQSNPNNWAINPAALAADQLLVYLPSITTKTDGRGNLWRYEYDSRGYVTRMTAPDGAITQYTYDAGTRMVESMTDANNHTTQYRYDSQGNRTKITLSAPFNYVTSFTYEPVFNMMTSMADPKGRVTSFTYDGRGNRMTETDPLAQTRQWTYDNHGNVLTETDKRGNTTTYHYDAGGNRDTITAPPPFSYITGMTYDGVGNLKTLTDPNNHTTMFDYDRLNRLTTETDPAGNTTQTLHDGQGNRVQMIDRNGHGTSFQFDHRQRLIRTTDALGQMTTETHDANNNRTSMTDKNSHTTIFEHDVQNRLTTTTDAEGNVSTMGHDPAGNLTSSTDANIHTTIYTYDELNRRGTVTNARGDVTRFEYDMGGLGCGACGATPGSSLITKQTDGNGKVTYFKYDQLDRLTKVVRKEGDVADVIDPSDAVTSYSYDPNNNRKTLTEPNGNITAYEFDVMNRRTREENAAGDVTRFTYDGANNLKTKTAPNGNVITNTYDNLDRVVQADDSIGRVASSTYDNVGNRLSQTDGNGNTTRYTYDAIDRQVIVTDPLTRTTVTEFDHVGNVLKVTDREGHMTTNIYDDINRRTSTTDALGHMTRYEYDGVGNVLGITDANDQTTPYLYDSINRVIRETYADGGPNTRTFVYDAVNLIRRTDQKNQTTVYTYNDLYFLLTRAYPVGPADNLTYDLSARMLTAERGGWMVTYAYDGANRVTQTTQNGKPFGYVYDIPGRTRTVTYPGGRSITERMDFRNRLTAIDDAASPPPIVQYTYDLGNRVMTRSYRNLTVATYTYNANDWIKLLKHSVEGNQLAEFLYTFDNEGNKGFEDKLHDTGHSEVYRYDDTYRLIDYKVRPLRDPANIVTQTSYILDPVGNWTSKITDGVTEVRMYDKANCLIQIGSVILTNDDNGNLQQDAAYTYAYDEENRLTSVTRNADSAIVGQYQYDALGRRVRKIANPGGVPSTISYLHDDARIVEEQDASDATQATYVYGNYIDEELTMDRGGQTFYYHQNGLWSAEALTDSAANVVERYAYGAYGAVTISDGEGNRLTNTWGTPQSSKGNPYTFTGRQLDEETELYYYRARYNDSGKGRFLQRDPLGYFEDMNLYAYVGNKPVRFVDPFGEQPEPVAPVPIAVAKGLGKAKAEDVGSFKGPGTGTDKPGVAKPGTVGLQGNEPTADNYYEVKGAPSKMKKSTVSIQITKARSVNGVVTGECDVTVSFTLGDNPAMIGGGEITRKVLFDKKGNTESFQILEAMTEVVVKSVTVTFR